MIRFDSIEERRAWYRAYYKENREYLRKKDNARSAKKSLEKRSKRNEGLHPLMVSMGHKPRNGVIKICPVCKIEFYCGPVWKDRLCCNRSCTKKLLAGKTKICMVCRDEYPCSDSQHKLRNRKTCSMLCRSIIQREIADTKRMICPKSVKSIDRCLRYSADMEDWRKRVFDRDNYTCQMCGARNGRGKSVYLEAHHIKQFATHPELRFELSNGQTLCKPCHKKIPHIRSVKRKYKNQMAA